MIEANPYAMPPYFDTRDRVAKDRLDRSVQRTVDGRRKVGAPQGRTAAAGQSADDIDGETAARAAMPVHEAHFLYLVAQLS
jgi:hypothetical protein